MAKGFSTVGSPKMLQCSAFREVASSCDGCWEFWSGSARVDHGIDAVESFLRTADHLRQLAGIVNVRGEGQDLAVAPAEHDRRQVQEAGAGHNDAVAGADQIARQAASVICVDVNQNNALRRIDWHLLRYRASRSHDLSELPGARSPMSRL